MCSQLSDDQVIARLASTQHGVLSRRQLLAAGITGRQIDHRLQTGRLHAVHRGVYAVGHRPRTDLARWMAATLACDGALSGPGRMLLGLASRRLRLGAPLDDALGAMARRASSPAWA